MEEIMEMSRLPVRHLSCLRQLATLAGTMLTALVVAREWERGTMEAVLSTPASVVESLIGKLLPYFVLGMLATVSATLLAIHVFDVPLRGSWLALLLLSADLVAAAGMTVVERPYRVEWNATGEQLAAVLSEALPAGKSDQRIRIEEGLFLRIRDAHGPNRARAACRCKTSMSG